MKSPLHYELKVVDGRRTLVVPGFGWDDSLLEVVDGESVEFLSVCGVESDIEFVRRLGGLRRLVLCVQKPRDLRPLEALESVEELSLALGPGRTMPAALDRLPRLTDLCLDWVPGLESMAACIGLRRLLLGRTAEPNLAWLSRLVALESLTLMNSRKLKTLRGLEALERLGSLELTSLQALESLEGVESATSLQLLDVTTCRGLCSLERVSGLANLNNLAVSNCGDIKSLAPLRPLAALEEFFAIESTRILDNDLSPLMELPSLRRFGMKSRRTYSPSVDDVRGHLVATGRWID